MNKKAQAMMEFLMTYGWAILIVLLVIGALVYFGILSPRGLLPEKCTVDAPLVCIDKAVYSDGSIQILIENGNPHAINSISMTAEEKEGLMQCDAGTYDVPDNIASGAQDTISFKDCTGAEAGEKVSLDITIRYKDAVSEFAHTANGEIIATVSTAPAE